MKFRCVYCSTAFDAPALPPACPSCATPFTLVIGPKTKLFEIAQAVDRNGFELDTKLVPHRPEDVPLDFALAAGPDTEPRPSGCACHLEAGDSPCPVHGDDNP